MADRQVDRLLRRIRSIEADPPVIVGIDGHSGAGKSTLATELSEALEAACSVLVIEGDEFYAGGSDTTWDDRSAAEKANNVIEWRRQAEVLLALRSTGTATWRPFDWEADDWDREPAPLAPPVTAPAAELIVLEGAYSCRPELHHLLDLRVLLATPADERRRRLLGREGDAYRADWEGRWGEAEAYYFGAVMSPDRFDLVL